MALSVMRFVYFDSVHALIMITMKMSLGVINNVPIVFLMKNLR